MKELSTAKVIAFDLDGTLVDSIADLAMAANQMRIHLKLSPLDSQVLESYVGDGLASLVHRALTDNQGGIADNNLWQKGFEFYIQYYGEHLTDQTRPYKDVEDILGLLKILGFPLAVITNKNEIFAHKILTNLGLIDNFSLIIGGDTLSEKKPSALPLQHVAEVFNISPNELVMVGDSLNDIKAANAAKSIGIGVTYGYEPKLFEKCQSLGLKYAFLTDKFSEIYDQLKTVKMS